MPRYIHHEDIYSVKYLRTLLVDHRATLLIFVCILAVYGLSFYKRQANYNYWMEHPEEYVVEQVTAMSTLDAYWWLKVARDVDAGRIGKGLTDPTRGYPDVTNYPQEPPLLAKLISLCTPFTGGDYYRAGLMLVPLLAGLFVFPLFLYCQTLGFGASAVLGGLIGSFSWSYYSRSNTGCVDTDLLNLFFPMAISALMLLINREQDVSHQPCAGSRRRSDDVPVQLVVPETDLLRGLSDVLRRLPVPHATPMETGGLHPADVCRGIRPSAYLAQHRLRTGHPVHLFCPRPTGQIVWPDFIKTIQEIQVRDLATLLEDLHGSCQ